MPFLSSASGSKNGIFLRSNITPPTVTILPTTNYNQDRATFNAQVDGNGSSTTVVFEYSTSSSFTSYSSITAANSPTISGLSTMWVNATGLSVGTTYYVRARCTNGGGVVVSGSTNFTTWSLQVYERTATGGVTFTIPTVTPNYGTPVTVSIYDIIMFGGGGGGVNTGGGGGAYVSDSSRQLTGNRSITTSVGSAGYYSTATLVSTNATASTISGDITTYTAAGGITGNGQSGNGYSSGSTATYNAVPGSAKSADWTNDGYGGGGGAGGAGGNGSAGSWGATGGNGGIGVSITRGGVTIEGGAGGAGGASALESGTSTRGSIGSYNTYGSGGRGTIGLNGDMQAGQNGYIRFRYYAASALA